MDTDNQCVYCYKRFCEPADVIRHQVIVHPQRRLAVTVDSAGTEKKKTRLYNIKGKDVVCDINSINIDRHTGKIQIPTRKLTESPVHKIKKINTPTKHVHKQLFEEIDENALNVLSIEESIDPKDCSYTNFDTDFAEEPEHFDDEATRFCSDIDISDHSEHIPVTVQGERLKSIVRRLRELLPSVTQHFLDKGRIEEWTSFFEQVDTGDIDIDHIASQLFWDVVKYNNIKTVQNMRFTADVKEFWTVGLSLFHAKFIRFMGGLKAQGIDRTVCRSHEPDISKVNFICPDLKILQMEKKRHEVGCDKPGIITSNIQAVAKLPASKTKTFKICIDGKKITAGFGKKLGEVDLFGHDSPTLEEKQERLNVEEVLVSQTQALVEKWLEIDIETIDSLTKDKKTDLHSNVVDLISVLTERIKELRTLKVKRTQAIEKFLKLAEEPWQKSKYSYVISSMKTQLLKLNMCIDEALHTIDRLGLIAAACNDVFDLYSLDKTVDLDQQSNYVCLYECFNENDSETQLQPPLIKQRSAKWLEIRQRAKVTGSTMHKAVGLSTLKEQQKHFEKVMHMTEQTEEFSVEQMQAMSHGVKNEINGIGLLVSKVLPVFEPTLCYYEEGCYCLKGSGRDELIVVSPDGSCRRDGKPSIAVEIKCPVPGKRFTPDVHYKIPDYYICQILSEMKALGCDSLLYICWTPQSSTVFRARFQEELWLALMTEIEALFPLEREPVKPKRKREITAVLKDMIKSYLEHFVDMLAEFPSSNSRVCSHTGKTSDSETGRGYHTGSECQDSSVKQSYLQLIDIGQIIIKAGKCIEDMYKVLRTPGKEVLVAVLSDMDRMKHSEHAHAIPIAYGLSGYSLKVEVVRSMLDEIISACKDEGLKIIAVSSDGQFYRLAVRNKSDEPLTILQLAKDTWSKAKKMTKVEEIKLLMEANLLKDKVDIDMTVSRQQDKNGDYFYCGPIYVNGIRNKKWRNLYNPPKLLTLIASKGNKETDSVAQNDNELNDLPPDVMNRLPGCIVDFSTETLERKNSEPEVMEISNEVDFVPCDEDDAQDNDGEYIDTQALCPTEENTGSLSDQSLNVYTEVVALLKETDGNRKNPKWKTLDAVKLKNFLTCKPDVLKSRFTKNELGICAFKFKSDIEQQSGASVERLTKLQLINAFAALSGHKETVVATKSPKTLRCILKDFLSRKVCKEALNAVIATDMFLQTALPTWKENATFRDGITVGTDTEPYIWYSKPEYCAHTDQLIFYLLDCHHLFVNARCFVVQNGITGLKVSKQAWICVAENSSDTGVGLNIAMVRDVIDRQSNAIAQITFSENVESEMRKLGWDSEAAFCQTIREWYMAEDEPGLDVMERHKMRMRLRHMLLDSVNLAEFPPPGSHVAGMPIVMFEGMLTNIDRRTQLYAMVPGNMYNVRTPTSLDAENLFCQFRDLDPKSTGVLMADDIPSALENASFVLQRRLDPERNYVMHTAKSARMYPENVLHTDYEGFRPDTGVPFEINRAYLKSLEAIPMRNHPFDVKDRGGRKPKRKSAKVPGEDEPARGTQPVRQHHRMDSSKILPHIRFGMTDI